jgi:hypothetical protein
LHAPRELAAFRNLERAPFEPPERFKPGREGSLRDLVERFKRRRGPMTIGCFEECDSRDVIGGADGKPQTRDAD